MAASMTDLCLLPAGAPPPGQESNFDNPASLATTTIAVMSVLVAWAVFFFSVRLYVNIKQLHVADVFSLVALLVAIAIMAVQFTQLRTARHIWDIRACYFTEAYAQSVFITALLFNVGTFFAIGSLFLLYFRIFSAQPPMRIAIWSGFAFLTALCLVGVVIACVYETPMDGATWLETISVRALIPLTWWQIQSGLKVGLDLYLFILPIVPVYQLQMSLRKRIAVISVFSLAVAGIGASVASLYERIHIQHTTDTTWTSTILTVCSFVELTVAIIVGCAPAAAGSIWRGIKILPSWTPILRSYFSRQKSSQQDSIPKKMPDEGSESDEQRGGDSASRSYEMVRKNSALTSEHKSHSGRSLV